MAQRILLGDEAVALGAIHAGLSAAYAYPGTPSTEIMEFVLDHAARHGAPRAAWCANEKTAYESALGACFAGQRALVTMKHVGLNVAADPFVSSALVEMHGGLVIAVADDPGMHSSQNEQDSRWYADFAHIPCLEPANQQQAYDMAREAFELSERFHVSVMLRLGTRLSHSRTAIEIGEARAENPPRRPPRRDSWILLPANARQHWRSLLERQPGMLAWSEGSPHNALAIQGERRGLGVITTGIALNYYEENASELPAPLSRLHIGTYPIPVALVRRLVDAVDRVLVLEDGYPYVERLLRGVLEPRIPIEGRMSGAVPASGELTPDVVRAALGLPPRPTRTLNGLVLPNRSPQLCQGCPHGFMFDALKRALGSRTDAVVTSDIGCYSLGALPPYSAIDSCVCMGASIGMARGAAEAGLSPVVAVIGDSTFLHSGITGLLDAVASNANFTLVILDNQAVAMTGAQDPIVPSARLREIVLGAGVPPERLHVLDVHPRKVDEIAAVLRREIAEPGLSVVIGVRECKVKLRRKPRAAAQAVRA